MRGLAILIVAASLGACSERGLEPAGRDVARGDPSTPVASPPISPGSAPPTSGGMDPAADQCGAKAHQWLVGRPRSTIPASLPLQSRIACTTCPISEDYSPQRLNIFYDERTGIVKEVRCG